MKITDLKSLGQAIRMISDLERGKPTAEIEKTIRLINILGMNILLDMSGIPDNWRLKFNYSKNSSS